MPNLGYFGKIWEQFFIHRSTVIFLLVPSIFPFSIGPVLLAIAGVYCGFGAMFSKTWRVHQIFTNIKKIRKVKKKITVYWL